MAGREGRGGPPWKDLALKQEMEGSVSPSVKWFIAQGPGM